jgi:hypothetical protein
MITVNEPTLIIPDYDPVNPEPYPGNIKPGYYTEAEIEQLLKTHKDNAEALQFFQDMLEE